MEEPAEAEEVVLGSLGDPLRQRRPFELLKAGAAVVGQGNMFHAGIEPATYGS